MALMLLLDEVAGSLTGLFWLSMVLMVFCSILNSLVGDVVAEKFGVGVKVRFP